MADPTSSARIQPHDLRVSCANILIPANAFVVFEVACSASWWIDGGGSIALNFGSADDDYRVACPLLQADLLTLPDGPIESIAGAVV